MPDMDEAVRTQVRNIEPGSGNSMDEWVAWSRASGPDQARRDRLVAQVRARDDPRQRNLVALTASAVLAPEG